MKPVYFPFTNISRQLATAYAACFGCVTIYQPTQLNVPEHMKDLEANNLIKIRYPEQQDDEKVMAICREYKNFGTLFQKDDIKSFKSYTHESPFYGDASPHKIRDDIQKYLKKDTTSELSSSMASRIFLQLAQEYDMLHEETKTGLHAIKVKEQTILDQLKGNLDDIKMHSTEEGINIPDDTGGYLTKDRILSWANLMCLDKENCDLLITSSPSVWNFLKDLSSDAEILFDGDFISGKNDRISGEAGEDQDIAAYMESLLINPWPRISPDKPEFSPSNGDKLCFSLFIVPDIGPNAFFANLLKVAGIKNQCRNQDQTYKNTLIALAVLA